MNMCNVNVIRWQWLEAAAEAGSAAGMFAASLRLASGRGVVPDEAKALKMLQVRESERGKEGEREREREKEKERQRERVRERERESEREREGTRGYSYTSICRNKYK